MVFTSMSSRHALSVPHFRHVRWGMRWSGLCSGRSCWCWWFLCGLGGPERSQNGVPLQRTAEYGILSKGRQEYQKMGPSTVSECKPIEPQCIEPPACRKCGGEMQEIVSIAPTVKEPGLVAYECRRCGHKTSVLQQADASRER
jgi:hypothetical protein